MSILNKFLSKETTRDYFIILGVEEYHIRAAIAEVSGNQISIIGEGVSEYTGAENETEAADIAISTAEKNLSQGITVSKVVFALPLFYLEKDKVKPEYLTRLKKITKELDLTPSGFVEYPQAISFYLEKEDGSPPTLILLSIGKMHLTFSLVRVGKLVQNLILPRGEDIATDIENALPNLQAEILPSRIILYDESEKLEHVREQLLRFPWHKHTSFLHTPKIEILSSTKVLTALVEAGGSSFIPLQNQVKQLTADEEKKAEKKEEVKEQKIKEEIVEEKKEEQKEEETFGFTTDDKEAKEDHENIIIPKNIPSLKLPNISFKLPNFPIISSNLILLIVSFIILGLFISFSVVTYPRALVSLVVYPLVERVETEITITTDSASNREEKNIVIARLLTEEVNGQKVKETTGTTNVGERAKGEVTVYNKTLSSKTIPKGAVLLSGDLKFTLDEDVNIASASDTGEGLTFGKVNAKITASSIGPESNFPPSTSFTFKDFPESSYTAKTSQGLTGGTSRQVASVAKEDQISLEKSLTEELETAAKQKLLSKLEAGDKLLEGTLTRTVTSKKFSQDVGAEAKEVQLTLGLKITAYVYQEEQLADLAASIVTNLPTGFNLDRNRTGIKIERIKTDPKEGKITALATISANFWPDLDLEDIKNNLAGKSYDAASSYLQSVEHIGGFRIIAQQRLPITWESLPISPNNITVYMVTN